AYAINDGGLVVGEGDSTTQAHGFIYSGGTFTDLRPLGIRTAYAINNGGQVAGKNTAGHAVLYTGGSATDIGTLGGSVSRANGINANGQVVGEAETGASDAFGSLITHAFLFSNGQKIDLGSLGGT